MLIYLLYQAYSPTYHATMFTEDEKAQLANEPPVYYTAHSSDVLVVSIWEQTNI